MYSTLLFYDKKIKDMERIINSVLLVDDDEATNVYNTVMIEDTGITDNILAARSVTEALNILNNAKENIDTLPELILLDINMPIMNGWYLLEELKHFEPEVLSRLNIVMLSASDNPNDIKKIDKYPFVIDYLSKPLSEDKIQKLIGKYRSNAGRSTNVR